VLLICYKKGLDIYIIKVITYKHGGNTTKRVMQGKEINEKQERLKSLDKNKNNREAKNDKEVDVYESRAYKRTIQ
jgi:hypothetical protein